MTRSQFAAAVGADEKWVENTARILELQLEYNRGEAVWFGLVRLFNDDVGVSLSRAAELANEALGRDPHSPSAIVGKTESSNAGITIDLARYFSSFGVSLSTALTLGGPRRRGRRRSTVAKGGRAVLEDAARYGVDLDLLREGLKAPVAQRMRSADENAAFVSSMRASAATRR